MQIYQFKLHWTLINIRVILHATFTVSQLFSALKQGFQKGLNLVTLKKALAAASFYAAPLRTLHFWRALLLLFCIPGPANARAQSKCSLCSVS